jgi:hypothetical protein
VLVAMPNVATGRVVPFHRDGLPSQ